MGEIARTIGGEAKTCGIPALKDKDGTWILSPEGKAAELAEGFMNKFEMSEVETKRYSSFRPGHCTVQWELLIPIIC